eukprot:15458831-Alexandrium_andersonii.AAC.1
MLNGLGCAQRRRSTHDPAMNLPTGCKLKNDEGQQEWEQLSWLVHHPPGGSTNEGLQTILPRAGASAP